jgi:protoheme IX farnesyltransferase
MKPQADIGEANLSLTWTRVSDYMALTKPRITLFVALSTAVGFVLGATGSLDLARLLHTVLATLVIAGGAAVLNQFLERDLDARMRRTKNRPLPAGRLQPEEAYVFGLLLSALGILYLGMVVNWLAGILAGLTSGIYLFLYTPLKQKTAHNTAVGAIAGALPPVGGWAAARGEVGAEAWVLFAIMFLWQFPHFFSIAWIYREDYVRGGHRMISVEDSGGDRISQQVVLYSLVLLPFSLLPALVWVSGTVYFIAAVVLGLGLLRFSFSFARYRTEHDARRLLRATLVYLPTLWVMMVLDKIVL